MISDGGAVAAGLTGPASAPAYAIAMRWTALDPDPGTLEAAPHGAVGGLEMKPLEGNDVCCGFGGTFCVKYPAISNAVVAEKAAAIGRSGAQVLLGGDLGCLINRAGKLQRDGSPVRVYHAAEVLAGMADAPSVGRKG